MSRRSTFTGESVTYGAVAATLDPDILRYPPAGFRASEDSVRLGSGSERFESAAEALMTWGIQRGAGLTVTDVFADTSTPYHGVILNPDGTPVAQQPARETEDRFGPDGTPYITAGTTAVIRSNGRLRERATPILVVYVIDEPERVGFAYGTTTPGPETGEEAFLLERREDDTVWLTIRSLQATACGIRWLTGLRQRSKRRVLTQMELRALHPAHLSSRN